MYKRLFYILMMLLASGCATARIPFPETELSSIDLKGDKMIKGRVFLIDQLEEEQIGSELELTLEPVTSYSDQWQEVVYQGNRSLKKADPRYDNFVLKSKTDEKGKYIFKDIAPGNYYLTAPFKWEAITCSARVTRTLVWVSKKIAVKPTDNVLEIPLTKEFTSPTIICDIYNQGAWETEGDF